MMTVVIPAGVGPGGQFAVPLPMPVANSYGTRSRPKGNAAARRQYQQARRRGDGKLHKVHWGVIACVEINQCVGCTSHFSAMTRSCWPRRAVRNRHRHAIEQAARRWRGGRRDDSARTRRKILISTQVMNMIASLPGWLLGCYLSHALHSPDMLRAVWKSTGESDYAGFHTGSGTSGGPRRTGASGTPRY